MILGLRTQIGIFRGREKDWEKRVKIPGVKKEDVRVYGSRSLYPIDQIKEVKDEFTFMTPPFIDQISYPGEKKIIVSAYLTDYFTYHFGSIPMVDLRYVAIRTSEQNANQIASNLERMTGENVIAGISLDISNANKYFNKATQDRAEEFLKLSQEEQRRRLEELL